MDFANILVLLSANKDAIATLGGIVTILATLIGAFWAWRKSPKSDSDPAPAQTHFASNGNQIVAPMTASNGGVIRDIHLGDVHNYGLSVEDAWKIAEKLAAEKGEKDAQVIKSLQETIQALTKQSTEIYNIQQALDLLAHSNTIEAEKIFASIASSAKRKGREANLEEAEALRHLGSLAFLHDTQKALDAYQRSTKLDPDSLEGWNQLGNLYRRIGELENSENACMTVLKLAGEDRTNQAVAYGNLGSVYQIRGDLGMAIDYYQKSLTINEALGRKEGMASDYGNLGIVYRIRGDLDQAIEYYQKSLAINEVLGRKEGMANQYGSLGIVYQIRGDLGIAIDYYQKSLAINEVLGRKEGMANQYGNLGNVYGIRGDHDQAIEYYQKSLAINEALDRKEGMARDYCNLGIVYRIRRDLDQAIEYFQKSLVINEALGSKIGIASDYGNLGVVFGIRGDQDQAIEYFQKSLAINEALGTKEGMAYQYGNLGNFYRIRGDLDQAIVYWKKSLALSQQVGAKEIIDLVQSWLNEIKQDASK